ncbi:MAG: Uma2 family endonuclease [Chloroflexi bacterium]|nr:Uma2 family endonuclease [Chloroflexota bacterium]
MALPLTRRRFTIREFEQMVQAGIFTEDDRLELIAGEIVEMTPIGRRHAACVVRLTHLLMRSFGSDAQVSVQNPLQLDEENQPQPDLMLLVPRVDFYAAGHPRPADVLLLVEVAESSREVDRTVKLPLYARYAIAEVWLVDLEGGTLTVAREPGAEGYRFLRSLGRGERLSPLAFPDRSLAVADILG